MPSSVLQIIAMVTMFIDHTAYVATYGDAKVIFLNYIGRIAFPVFCFQIALGYKKTKDLGKYILRLLAIAAISQIPYFIFFNNVALIKPGLNVIFTLLFGIIAILIYDFTIEGKKVKINTGLNFGEKYSKLSVLKMTMLFIVKLLGIIGLCYLAEILDFEYGAKGIVLTLGMFALYPFKEERSNNSTILNISKSIMYFILVCIFTYFEAQSYINALALGYMQYLDEVIGLVIGVIVGCLLPFLYNGNKGKKIKWIGYIFYPLQLAIIILINIIIH